MVVIEKLNQNSTSGKKGHLNKLANKWQVSIVMKGIKTHLGYFINKDDALMQEFKKQTNYSMNIQINANE